MGPDPREFGLRSINGNFVFVFIGRVKQDINAIELPLYGHVYLFKHTDTWKNELEPAVRNCQAFISRYQQNLLEQVVLEDRVIDSIKLTKGRLEIQADISARIILKRPGDFILSHITPRRKEFLELDSDLRVYANLDLSDIIAAQFYYFMRDISHTHQHHHKTTDTILSAQKSTNDIDWRKSVLFSLYNHIIARKRTANLLDAIDSLGILAYARSFYRSSQEQLEVRGLWANHKKNFPTFSDETLIESINTSIRRMENIEKARYSLKQNRWHKKTWHLGFVYRHHDINVRVRRS